MQPIQPIAKKDGGTAAGGGVAKDSCQIKNDSKNKQ